MQTQNKTPSKEWQQKTQTNASTTGVIQMFTNSIKESFLTNRSSPPHCHLWIVFRHNPGARNPPESGPFWVLLSSQNAWHLGPGLSKSSACPQCGGTPLWLLSFAMQLGHWNPVDGHTGAGDLQLFQFPDFTREPSGSQGRSEKELVAVWIPIYQK